MAGYLIDLFFSLKGAVSRREWLAGGAALALAAVLGVFLFNDASFDESANAVPDVPTMAAVFWVFLCCAAFAVLSTKGSHDAGLGRRGFLATVAPVATLALAWSTGYAGHGLMSLWLLLMCLGPLVLVGLAPPKTAS